MFPSILIIGGTRDERLQKARPIIEKHKIAKEDQLIMSSDTSIGIDSVRQLSKQLSLRPFASTLKVVLIHPAELLTYPAQQALLKTLEEPPKHSLIILTSEREEMLLSTIVSRCRIISLFHKQMSEERIAHAADLLQLTNQGSTGALLEKAAILGNKKEQAQQVIKDIIGICRLGFLKKGKEAAAATAKLDNKKIIQIIQQSKISYRAIEANVDPRFSLEQLFFNIKTILLS